MKKIASQSGKKRVGRPAGRKAPHRPVLSTRVPQSFYDELRTLAVKSNRTMAEELIWRVQQTFVANIHPVPPGYYIGDTGRLVPYPKDATDMYVREQIAKLMQAITPGLEAAIAEVIRKVGEAKLAELPSTDDFDT